MATKIHSLIFGSKTLTFTYESDYTFRIGAYTFSEEEMGKASFTCDLFAAKEIDPGFSFNWKIDIDGEKFVLKSLVPSGIKNTDSIEYKYTLIFSSERDDLLRYIFANLVSGTQPSISYDFAFIGDIDQFAERFNLNLTSNLGTRWTMVVSEGVTSSTETVECSKVSLFALLQKTYEIYGLRWRIYYDSGLGKMVILIMNEATDAIELSHQFEYGYQSGLIEIERNNATEKITTRLSGMGGTKNVPPSYFHDAVSIYPADPDRNENTDTTYYTHIMPKAYRDYVQGWNGKAVAVQTPAYVKGVADKLVNVWNPVDYIDSPNISKYGIWKDALDANEEIFPSLQGMTDALLGRLDEVLAVESVLNDIYDSDSDDSSTNNYEDIPNASISQYVPSESSGLRETITNSFDVTKALNEISFNVTQTSNIFDELEPDYDVEITISLVKTSDSSVVDTVMFEDIPAFGDNLLFLGSFQNVALGNYTLKMGISVTNRGSNINVTSEINTIKVYNYVSEDVTTKYKQTFDIWIKNIWNTTYQDSEYPTETPEEYTDRVWDPLKPTTIQGEMKVMWSDGLLAGEDYEFIVNKIEYNNDVTDSHWKLTLIKSDAELEATDKYLPNKYQNAVAGNHFFFINIVLPQSYIYSAEEQVESYMATELAKVDEEFPTYTCKPSSIFCATFAEVDKIRAGSRIFLMNERLIGSSAVGFYINSVEIAYNSDSLLPDWTIVISDKVLITPGTISTLQGDVKRLSNNVYSNEQTIQQVVKQFDMYFLRKDGLGQSSSSPTNFDKNLSFGKNLTSKDFVQGFIGGQGAGLIRDSEGNAVLEVDKLSVRKTLNVNELIVNQTTVYGGKYLYSAAGMEVIKVEDTGTSYRCYMDTKQGTRLNQFIVNDQAYCQRFAPSDNSIIKMYWRLVTAVGSDYIDLSKTDCVLDSGIPSVGDNIAQVGNRNNIARQSVLIIDQLSGGSVVQYSGIDSYSWTSKNYVGYGVNPLTGKAFLYSYGDMFFGDRDITDPDSTWITFQQAEGDTKRKLKIRAALEIGAGSSGLSNLSEWQAFEDRITDLEGNSVYLIDLTNENASVACDADGNVTGLLPTTQAIVYIWGAVDTGWVFSAVFNGCAGSIDDATGEVTITELSAENGTVVITATKEGLGNLSSTFTMTKVRSGNNVVIYFLQPSVEVIKSVNGTYIPATITCAQMKQSGNTEPIVTTDKSVSVQFNGTGDIIPLTNYTDGIITLSGAISYLDFILYDTNGTTILDKQRVPVVSNGTSGKSAITILMTNEAHTFPATNAGSVTSYAGSGTSFRAWQGTTELLVDNSDPYTSGTFRVSSALPSNIVAGSTSPVDGSIWQTYGNCSGMATGSDTANISFVITVVTLEGEVLYFNKVQTFSKSKMGDSAIIYALVPSVNIIRKNAIGPFTPTTISCSKTKQVGSSLPETTTEKTIKYSINGGAQSTYSSELTISDTWSYIDFYLYDGTTILDKERVPVISDGESNYNIDLTNENASAACDSNGVVTGTIPSSQAMVYFGAVLQTGWTFGATFVGCTGSINSSTGQIVVTALSADNASVTVSASKTDKPTLSAIFTITKVKAGADAVIYSVEPSVNIIKIANTIITPSTITCAKIKQIGSTAPAVTTEKTLKYSVDGGTENTYSGAITIVSTWSYIDFILYDTDGTTILDKERVPVISDGESNYYIDLTNENASAACDSNGVVTGTIPSSQAMVYFGAILQTGWTFSATFTGCTGSINSSTGEIAVTALSADNAIVTVSASKTDKPTLSIIFTITKVKAGANAVIYSVEPSVNIIKIANSIITPSTITCAKIKQIGSTAPAVTTEKILKYSVDGGTENTYSGAITIVSTWSYIDFILYDGATVLDKERVLIVVDGTDAATKAKETMAQLLGYGSLTEMESALANSTTIIDKGHIRTQLLEAFSILVNNLSTSATYPAIVLSKSSNSLQAFDASKALRVKVTGEDISTPGTSNGTFNCIPKDKSISIISGHTSNILTFTDGNTLATINPAQSNNHVVIPETYIELSSPNVLADDFINARVDLYVGSLLVKTFFYEYIYAHGSAEVFTLPSQVLSLSAGVDTTFTIHISYDLEVSAGNPGFDFRAQVSYASATGTISYTNNLIEMGKNGMRVMYATNKYMEASFNPSTSVMTLVMRNGNYGFSVTDSGLKKMINGTNWVAL